MTDGLDLPRRYREQLETLLPQLVSGKYAYSLQELH